jgi:uncharacterized cupin superfamily protein
MKARPSFIRHWRDVEYGEPFTPPGLEESFAFHAPLAPATGLTRLRVDHMRLVPGNRTNPPGASRDEEEIVFVLEGKPDVWADGHVWRLEEGDGVWFNDSTGMAHSFLNNSNSDVRLFAMSEGPRYASKFFHPLERDVRVNDVLKNMDKLWEDVPRRELGPHDGLTRAQRGHSSPAGARKSGKPDFAIHWRNILDAEASRYPGSDEDQGLDARFGQRARFSRLGVHVELLKAGRRTSWPHAERDEEEFVFVVAGQVDAWIDGYIHAMREGDFIGFPARTGITHTIVNNSDADALLITGSEASRARNQFFYPFHEQRNRDVGALYWSDHPELKLGPHDGMPDALRAKLAAGGVEEKKKHKRV